MIVLHPRKLLTLSQIRFCCILYQNQSMKLPWAKCQLSGANISPVTPINLLAGGGGGLKNPALLLYWLRRKQTIKHFCHKHDFPKRSQTSTSWFRRYFWRKGALGGFKGQGTISSLVYNRLRHFGDMQMLSLPPAVVFHAIPLNLAWAFSGMVGISPW